MPARGFSDKGTLLLGQSPTSIQENTNTYPINPANTNWLSKLEDYNTRLILTRLCIKKWAHTLQALSKKVQQISTQNNMKNACFQGYKQPRTPIQYNSHTHIRWVSNNWITATLKACGKKSCRMDSNRDVDSLEKVLTSLSYLTEINQRKWV